MVTGWTLKDVLASLGGQLDGPGAEQYWVDYSASVWQALGFHAVSVLIGAAVISRGVVQGIERANKVLIPLLLGLLIVAVVRSVTLPVAERGLRFLFPPAPPPACLYRTRSAAAPPLPRSPLLSRSAKLRAPKLAMRIRTWDASPTLRLEVYRESSPPVQLTPPLSRVVCSMPTVRNSNSNQGSRPGGHTANSSRGEVDGGGM